MWSGWASVRGHLGKGMQDLGDNGERMELPSAEARKAEREADLWYETYTSVFDVLNVRRLSDV